jgi:3',5'-cyclic AMP phosphodiesterase CpdA
MFVHFPQDVRLMVLRFLHLSDIHFGQEKDGTLIPHDFVRDELIKDVKKLADQRGPASRVIVTGDVAYSGKSDEYDRATAWLEKLTNACGLGDTHVSTIPGNHDCDLTAISNQAKMIQAKFRTNDADQVRADLHGIYQDGEAANPFFPNYSSTEHSPAAMDVISNLTAAHSGLRSARGDSTQIDRPDQCSGQRFDRQNGQHHFGQWAIHDCRRRQRGQYRPGSSPH